MVQLSRLAAFMACSIFMVLAAPDAQNSKLQLYPRADNVTTVNAGAGAVGQGDGSQFIGGGCINDADCGSGCCAGGAISGSTGRAGVGICSGQGSGVEFQKGKTGCGFEDPDDQTTLDEAAAQVEEQGF